MKIEDKIYDMIDITPSQDQKIAKDLKIHNTLVELECYALLAKIQNYEKL